MRTRSFRHESVARNIIDVIQFSSTLVIAQGAVLWSTAIHKYWRIILSAVVKDHSLVHVAYVMWENTVMQECCTKRRKGKNADKQAFHEVCYCFHKTTHEDHWGWEICVEGERKKWYFIFFTMHENDWGIETCPDCFWQCQILKVRTLESKKHAHKNAIAALNYDLNATRWQISINPVGGPLLRWITREHKKMHMSWKIT